MQTCQVLSFDITCSNMDVHQSQSESIRAALTAALSGEFFGRSERCVIVQKVDCDAQAWHLMGFFSRTAHSVQTRKAVKL